MSATEGSTSLTYNWSIDHFAIKTFKIFTMTKDFSVLPLSTANPPVKLHVELSSYGAENQFVLFKGSMSCSDQGIDCMARYTLSIVRNNLMSKRKKHRVLSSAWHFLSSRGSLNDKWVLVKKRMRRSRLLDQAKDFLVGGTLTLQCKLFYKKRLGDLSDGQHWRALLASGDFSDVTVVVGGKSFALHKNILARSPVFKRMFQGEFIEAKEGRVEIDDVEVEVFEEFVRYLYTGDVNMEEHVADMLALGEKYELEQLKCLCGEWLASNLNINSVVCFLLFADLYNEPGLKDKCLTFISKNLKAVRATDEWKELVSAAQRIDLLEEVLAKMDL